MVKTILLILPFLLSAIWQFTNAGEWKYDYEQGRWRDPNGYSCFGGRCGWTDATWEKYEKMRTLGFSDFLATDIINECKKKAKDPNHCVVTASFIAVAESGAGTAVTGCNNVFGISGKCFKDVSESVDDWTVRYGKYWYRRENPSHFYSDTPKRKPPTRYCMSEESSASIGYCPNGFRHAWNAYNFLTK